MGILKDPPAPSVPCVVFGLGRGNCCQCRVAAGGVWGSEVQCRLRWRGWQEQGAVGAHARGWSWSLPGQQGRRKGSCCSPWCCWHSLSPVILSGVQHTRPAACVSPGSTRAGSRGLLGFRFQSGSCQARPAAPTVPARLLAPAGALPLTGHVGSSVQRKAGASSQKNNREERKEGKPIKHFLLMSCRFTALAPLIWLLGFIFSCLINESMFWSLLKCGDHFHPPGDSLHPW